MDAKDSDDGVKHSTLPSLRTVPAVQNSKYKKTAFGDNALLSLGEGDTLLGPLERPNHCSDG
jgi:hypothetical protein